MDTKELLKKRRALKARKPEFIRQDAHKKKKVGWKWRKPKGSDSKMRVGMKGFKRSVRIGWSSPAVVRGSERNGLFPVTVNCVRDLDKVDPKTQAAVIGSTVGIKKKIELIEKALAKSIHVVNHKDPQKLVSELKERFEKKKTEKKMVKADREKKREEVKKEGEKKKAKEKAESEKSEKSDEDLTEEEKKQEDKKEKDKLLISTQ